MTVLSFVPSFMCREFIKYYELSVTVVVVFVLCKIRRILAEVDILNNLGRNAYGLKGDLLVLGRVKPSGYRVITNIRESNHADNDTN